MRARFPPRNDMLTHSCRAATGSIVSALNTWIHPDFCVAAPSSVPSSSRHNVGPTPKSTSSCPHVGDEPYTPPLTQASPPTVWQTGLSYPVALSGVPL